MTTVPYGDRRLPEKFWKRVHPDPTGCWLWCYGNRTPRSYGKFFVDGKLRYAHRVIFGAVVGEIPAGMEIDHTCHVKRCVNPAHLRLATLAQNCANIRPHAGRSSIYKGVSWCKKTRMWRAKAKRLGRTICLGRYREETQAAMAYDAFAKDTWGDFALTNSKAGLLR